MIKMLLPFIMAMTIYTSLSAQQKTISYQQAFGDNFKGIVKPLATFYAWGNHSDVAYKFIEDGVAKYKTLNINSGIISEYHPVSSYDQIIPLFIPKNALNFSWSDNHKYATYTFGNNLFLYHDSLRRIIQLTTDGSDVILNGYAPWLYYEEILGKWMNHRAFWLSPDSKSLVFIRFDETEVAVSPILVSKDIPATVQRQRFPIVGGKNPKVQMGYVDLTNADKKVIWAAFDKDADQYFRAPYFSATGEIWLQWINRKQNNLKVFALNKTDGSLKEVYNEKSNTWVSQTDNLYFLPNNKGFIYRTDQSGWAHFNLHDMNGKLINPITTGNYHDAAILHGSDDGKTIWFTARKENSTRNDLYRVDINGKNLQRITKGEFDYTNISISRSGKYFVATYSNLTTPSVMAVFDNNGKLVKQIDAVKASTFADYKRPRKELLRVKSSDGKYDLPIIITYPLNFDSTKTYPVLMNVYGGPYRSEVMDRWTYSGVEQWFAQEGMIQVTADNRASWHFSKTALNEIYGKVGLLESEDFISIGKWLKQQPYVNAKRLGMMGYSFGGFMTCMALTYGSDVFDYGYAHWPLTDWHFYDTHYTECFMGSPTDNAEGYKKSSVFHYANKYKGGLRIVHGLNDDNTHIQHTIQLIDTLQNLNKSVEFMLYPGEKHGLIYQSAKWKHNKMELYKFYYKNLLDREIPTAFLEN